MTPEISAKLALFRQRAAQGIITREEMREGIELLRSVRSGAASAARSNPGAKARGTVPGIDAGAILKGLGEMVKK